MASGTGVRDKISGTVPEILGQSYAFDFDCYGDSEPMLLIRKNHIKCSPIVCPDRVHMTLVPRCALSMCSRGERYQSLLFVVRSDLCDLVEVGSVREVTGVPTHRLNHSEHTTVTTLVEVCMLCTLSQSLFTH